MNQALQPHTPTAHPLNYDALQAREGCGPESGSDILSFRAFVQLCVFSHDDSSVRFSQPDTVSYALGPASIGTPGAQAVTWTAWVATAGIRLGSVGPVTPPANGTGSASPFYATTTTTKIAHCFDSAGLLYMGIESSPGFIGLTYSYYIDGSSGTAGTSFPGAQPLLFNVANADQSGAGGVVCLYLRADHPFVLFARFSSEGFATEHQLMPDLRVNLKRLLTIVVTGNIVKLYARDELGRDVTLTSPAYATQIVDMATISTDFTDATMTQIVAQSEDTSSKSKLDCSFYGATMFDATAETSPLVKEKAVLGNSFESAEMEVVT